MSSNPVDDDQIVVLHRSPKGQEGDSIFGPFGSVEEAKAFIVSQRGNGCDGEDMVKRIIAVEVIPSYQFKF